MAMDYQRYITRDPVVCGGEPVVKGTRVTIRTVLASLGEGLSVEEIVKEFPTLDEEAVRAIIAFAAVSAEEDLPVPAAPSLA
jgi:uncharacterized protein (DUF433 family)